MGMLDMLKQGMGMLSRPGVQNGMQYLQMRHHGMMPGEISEQRSRQAYYDSALQDREEEKRKQEEERRKAEMEAAIQGEERSWAQGELANPAARATLPTDPARMMRMAEALPGPVLNAAMGAMTHPGDEEYKEYVSKFGGKQYATRVYSDGRTERRVLGPVDMPQQPIDDGYHPAIIVKNRDTGEAVFNQWNAEKQSYVPVIDGTGRPLLAANMDPTLRRQVAEAGAEGAVIGKDTGTAVTNLPMTELNSSLQIKQLRELRMHPGKDDALGMSSLIPTVRGSDRADFEARKAQLDGAAFLQAYQTLKGGGQITQIEGEKATTAINRAKAAQSEAEFDAAIDELIGMINASTAITRDKAGSTTVYDWNGLPDGS